MSAITVTVTNPGVIEATVAAGGQVSATVSSGGAVTVQLGESLAWEGITGKPVAFTPDAHTHQAADISDRDSALVTSVNGQTGAVVIEAGATGATWEQITGKPSVFPPEIHTHTSNEITDFASAAALYGPVTSVNGQTGAVVIDAVASDWSEITNKPTTFPPDSHTHQIADVGGLQAALDAAGGIVWSAVPTAPDDPATAGDLAYNSEYLFVATAADTWKRVPLNEWIVSAITITQQPQDATATGAELSLAPFATWVDHPTAGAPGGDSEVPLIFERNGKLRVVGIFNGGNQYGGDLYFSANSLNADGTGAGVELIANTLTLSQSYFTGNYSEVGAARYVEGTAWDSIILPVVLTSTGQIVQPTYMTVIASVPRSSLSISDGYNNTLIIGSETNSDPGYATIGAASGNSVLVIANADHLQTISESSNMTEATYRLPSVAQSEINSGDRFVGVAFGNGKFLCALLRGLIIESEYGSSWTVASDQGAALFYSLGFGGGQFFAIVRYSNTNKVALSANGSTWAYYDFPFNTNNFYSRLWYEGGLYFARGGPGNADFAYSADGITWHYVALPSVDYRAAAVFGDALVIADSDYESGATKKPLKSASITGGECTATFSVGASSTSGSLSYQWQESLDSGQTWASISGATSASLLLSQLSISDSGNKYRVIVSAPNTNAVTSNAATLTANCTAPPSSSSAPPSSSSAPPSSSSAPPSSSSAPPPSSSAPPPSSSAPPPSSSSAPPSSSSAYSVLLLVPFDTNTDSVVAGVTPTVSGTAMTISPSGGKFGGYASNTVATSTTTYAASFGNGDWTVECWIRRESLFSTNPRIIDLGAVELEPGTNQTLNFYYRPTDTNFSSSTFLTTQGQWHHIAIVYQSGVLRSYVDGIQRGSLTQSVTPPTSVQLTNTCSFDDLRLTAAAVYPDGITFTPPTSAHGAPPSSSSAPPSSSSAPPPSSSSGPPPSSSSGPPSSSGAPPSLFLYGADPDMEGEYLFQGTDPDFGTGIWRNQYDYVISWDDSEGGWSFTYDNAIPLGLNFSGTQQLMPPLGQWSWDNGTFTLAVA